MNILIFDTNILKPDSLKDLLSDFFDEHSYPKPHITVLHSSKELSEYCVPSDIAFLNPEADGIDLIAASRRLYHYNPNTIIFITASNFNFLDDAMSMKAFRYFAGFIDRSRLFKSLSEALPQYYSANSTVIVNSGKGSKIISANDIVFLETDDRKVVIHTGSDDYISVRSMQFWTDTLKDKYFYRCNRAYIINMRFVDSFTPEFVYLKRDKVKVKAYLTQRKFYEFKRVYNMFIENSAPD